MRCLGEFFLMEQKLKSFSRHILFEIYGKRKRCKKKRILVVSRNSEYSVIVQSLNRGLNNYQLENLPSVLGHIEEIVERQIRKGDYDGFLVDEKYTDFLPEIKHEGKKYGIIRWSDYYDAETRKIMTENKTVKFGAEMPTNIEKQLDAIFA